ncbi:MAG: bifunctional 3,4-dihydroxy-2-butanone-4-phosphate synthase/GTP cyclohydrolase II [Trueperaceae bacterium]|nr:bifunctional 3,4-dihydroxy-2-butanone-4-phosphate synthase/GTP cyclohydrolase II [Trueperaceae bacterium]
MAPEDRNDAAAAQDATDATRGAPLATVPELLAELRAGRPIIVVDDEDRENEGDFVFAAEHATPELLAFTIRHSGGIVCVAMPDDVADRLELPPMVVRNTARRETAFTVSIEATEGISTGISAADRAHTIRLTARPDARASDLARPGHVFPLRARDGGVLRRAGHTEAAVDLCRLAGLQPVGALSEVMRDDGHMMRLPEMRRFAAEHGLKIGTIADLIAHRVTRERFVERVTEAQLPTPWARFRVIGYRDTLSGAEHVAMVLGDVRQEAADDTGVGSPGGGEPGAAAAPVLVRMHSECLTGDALHSLRCDCGFQRDAALKMIADAGRGTLVYLRQEGRGIGLLNKLRAYALQDEGADTVEANELLGFAPDLRDYGVGAQILLDLGVHRLRLLTNNPRKVVALEGFGIEVTERVPLHVGENPYNEAYLATKRAKLGHFED